MKYTGFVEVIREGEIAKVSEKEALEEDLFILRKIYDEEPEVDKAHSLRPMQKDLREQNESSVKMRGTLRTKQPEYKKNNVLRELIDNFQWEIIKVRRMKNITRKRLAEISGVNENDIKMIEQGVLPRDDFVLINKIQQHLGISLRRDGKKFDLPVAQPKPAITVSGDVTLSDLQKDRESRVRQAIERVRAGHSNKEEDRRNMGRRVEKKPTGGISGEDIEIFE